MNKHLPLLAIVPALLIRTSGIAPGWVMALNLVLLPTLAVAVTWVHLMSSKSGLAVALAFLVASPLLGHPVFDVPVLLCVALVAMRSFSLWHAGSSPFSLAR